MKLDFLCRYIILSTLEFMLLILLFITELWNIHFLELFLILLSFLFLILLSIGLSLSLSFSVCLSLSRWDNGMFYSKIYHSMKNLLWRFWFLNVFLSFLHWSFWSFCKWSFCEKSQDVSNNNYVLFIIMPKRGDMFCFHGLCYIEGLTNFWLTADP